MGPGEAFLCLALLTAELLPRAEPSVFQHHALPIAEPEAQAPDTLQGLASLCSFLSFRSLLRPPAPHVPHCRLDPAGIEAPGKASATAHSQHQYFPYRP